MTPCYALYVTNERRAAQELAEAGFEAWAPTYRRARPGAAWTLRNVNGRARMASRPPTLIEAPIFPGYILARIPAEGFAVALELPHVVDAVRGASALPREMPESLLGDLVLLVMTGEMDEQLGRAPRVITRKLVVPLNRARTRKRRKNVARRLRKWLAEDDCLAEAA